MRLIHFLFTSGFFLLAALSLIACDQRFVRPQQELQSGEASDETSKNSIIGGEIKTSRNTTASRSVVIIEMQNAQGQILNYCTAGLIGPHTILTAGHCFDLKTVGPVRKFRVLFADRFETTAAHEQRPGLSFVAPPSFNTGGVYDHDIAVGIFAGDIPKGFNPVVIDQDLQGDYANETVYAYGYGRTQDYTGRKNEDLRYSLGTLYRGLFKIDRWYKETPDRYFTTETGPAHLCQGDSGGPQFLEKNGELKIVGVNSASYGPLLPNGVRSCSGRSQATKVAPFASWIRKEERRMLQNYYH